MIELKGRIEKIETENNNGRDKKVVTLQLGRSNTVFVEFQGKMADAVNDFNEGQDVQVKIRFNGKVSNLNRKYNNIVGKSIKSI